MQIFRTSFFSPFFPSSSCSDGKLIITFRDFSFMLSYLPIHIPIFPPPFLPFRLLFYNTPPSLLLIKSLVLLQTLSPSAFAKLISFFLPGFRFRLRRFIFSPLFILYGFPFFFSYFINFSTFFFLSPLPSSTPLVYPQTK